MSDIDKAQEEVKKFAAAVAADEAKIKTIWSRYDVWISVTLALIAGLIAGYHLHS